MRAIQASARMRSRPEGSPKTDRLRQKQACHLIERKGQLAYHDDQCNREEIEAVIHCRFSPNSRKAYAETKLVTCNDDSLT
jgi:hypothetical protein